MGKNYLLTKVGRWKSYQVNRCQRQASMDILISDIMIAYILIWRVNHQEDVTSLNIFE